LPHLGAERTDAGAAVSLQLEDVGRDSGRNLVELLLPVVSGDNPQPADHRVSLSPTAPHSRQGADRLGRAAGTSQPRCLGLRAAAERTLMAGISSCLRPATESGRVSVVALETARAAQLLSAEFQAVELLRSQGLAPNAEATHPRDCLLAAGRIIPRVTLANSTLP